MLKDRSDSKILLMTVAGVVVLALGWNSHAAQQPAVTRKVLMQQDLVIPGYTATMVAVEIPAGGREGKHTHPGTLVAYVQEGALDLEYEGKPTKTYKAGDTFSVEPGKVHEGVNKGNTPVKVVATFVIEKGKPLTTQVQ
jgi:quercetin dioxygenase-like cupin family protein